MPVTAPVSDSGPALNVGPASVTMTVEAARETVPRTNATPWPTPSAPGLGTGTASPHSARPSVFGHGTATPEA